MAVTELQPQGESDRNCRTHSRPPQSSPFYITLRNACFVSVENQEFIEFCPRNLHKVYRLFMIFLAARSYFYCCQDEVSGGFRLTRTWRLQAQGRSHHLCSIFKCVNNLYHTCLMQFLADGTRRAGGRQIPPTRESKRLFPETGRH